MPPNKSAEPTADGAFRFAVAVHVVGRRWFSFLVPRRFRWVEPSWSGPVAQTSQSAVSRASQPAGCTAIPLVPIWKSATQQVWKPALRDDAFQ